jgi:hypothetical protein
MPGCMTPPHAATPPRSSSSSPKAKSPISRTPTAERRRHAATQALLRLGANANALDAQGYDIVTVAAMNNDLEML